MFGFRKKETEKDEAQKFLDSVKDEPEMPDPDEKTDIALEEIAHKDAEAHYDILNLLVLAVIVMFFGVILLTLTNRQDFSNENLLTKESFFSGNYLARVEKNFNESIPLRDYLHNAESYIKYCFGIGNDTDIIDIRSKKDMDDPYSIENEPTDNSPLTDSEAFTGDETDDSAAETQPPQEEEEDEDITKRPVNTIHIRTQSTTTSSENEEQTSTTTNNRAPGATTTTTVPPQTSAEPTKTEPTTTEPQTETTPESTESVKDPEENE